jgi:DNA-3-methyladenine glycosylase II
MIHAFSTTNFHQLCNTIVQQQPLLQKVIDNYGYPPMWSRPANFESLVHIILEQQVSLESALAAYNKLKNFVGIVVPQNILPLTPTQMKACYITKQKASYLHALSTAVINQQLLIENLYCQTDEVVKQTLQQIKGIGEWTSTIFLMMCLHRSNCFPMGDVALITSYKELIHPAATKEQIAIATKQFEPNKTILAFILWWNYLKIRNRSF